jgi:hypothetical protein
MGLSDWLRKKGEALQRRAELMRKAAAGHLEGVVTMEGTLSIRHFRNTGRLTPTGRPQRKWVDLGVVSRRKVTVAFVNHLVDSLQNQTTKPIDTFKYHDSGTGVVAESNADTALGTPCGEARDVGTQIEGATPNIYKSVATHTYAGSFAITEHGLFSASSGPTLMDRSVFAAVNVAIGEKIEFTYELTCNAEA